MLVIFTNNSAAGIFLSQLYAEIAAGGYIQTQRTKADLDGDQTLKEYVAAGTISLAFTAETGDDVALGFSEVPENYTDVLRPLATAVPAFTFIWNTDDEALNWSDGTDWRDANGALT